MYEKKAKGDFSNEAKQAKLDLAEKISECNKLELKLKKKDEEVDLKRRALQDLQTEYQGMMNKNLDINQTCKNQDIRIKELEKEINKLNNCTQIPEKRRRVEEKEPEAPLNNLQQHLEEQQSDNILSDSVVVEVGGDQKVILETPESESNTSSKPQRGRK